MVSGEAQSRYGIQLVARSIEVVDDPAAGADEGPHAGRFVPVYPVNKNIQARRMRTLIHRALDEAGRVLDPLPAELLSELAETLGVEEKLVAEIGGVVGSHVGLGAYGVAYL